MIHIVGSGPSGVACAVALVHTGHEVMMLDVGVQLEPDRKWIVDQLSQLDYALWDSFMVARLKENADASIGGIQLKSTYGSDFPYREVESYLRIDRDGVACLPTFAQGGFSNVWGANVLPYRAEDIDTWPVSIHDLEQHYHAVFDFVNLAAVKDDLDSILPLYTDRYEPLELCEQTRSFLTDLNAHKDKLKSEGFIFGQARLAVRSKASKSGPGCVYCGLCLYGCPYHLIYNSSDSLRELCRHDLFRYVPDVVVDKVRERNSEVTIFARSKRDGHRLEFKSTRVYLACGTLSTTRILLESLEAYDLPITVHDSQYFLLPCIRYQGTHNIKSERLHTLSQIYVELLDHKLNEHLIHLQFYMYNDFYLKTLQRLLKGCYRWFTTVSDFLLGRLLLVQGYIHSKSSSSFSLRLEKPQDSEASRMVLSAQGNPTGVRMLKGVAQKLYENKRYFRMLPVAPLLQIAKVGRGFHSGGTFPMSAHPADFQSDCLGRPRGFQRVHAVDATVFPSIPATTITLSTMANAHRIASNHDQI